MFREESEDKMQRRADILFPTMKDKKEKVTLEKENNKKIPGLGVSKFDFDKDDDDEDINNSKKQDNKEWAEILADYVNKQKKENREDILYPTMKDKTEKHNEDNKQDLDVKKIKINKKDIGYVTGGAACIQGISNEYIDNLKEINPVKRYEKNVINEFKQSLNNQPLDNVPKWSNNTKFSDEELKRARKFIQGIEKLREDAYYPTPNDKLTIGYGHTGLVDGKPIKLGMKITEKEAEELYRQDFETHTTPLKNIKVALTSNQKIALASFLFNLGPGVLNENSDVVKKLNKGDYIGASAEMDKYIKQKNKKTGKMEVLNGLIDRRAKEKKLFFTLDDY